MEQSENFLNCLGKLNVFTELFKNTIAQLEGEIEKLERENTREKTDQCFSKLMCIQITWRSC